VTLASDDDGVVGSAQLDAPTHGGAAPGGGLVRPITPGRLIVVFGSDGDRDQAPGPRRPRRPWRWLMRCMRPGMLWAPARAAVAVAGGRPPRARRARGRVRAYPGDTPADWWVGDAAVSLTDSATTFTLHGPDGEKIEASATQTTRRRACSGVNSCALASR